MGVGHLHVALRVLFMTRTQALSIAQNADNIAHFYYTDKNQAVAICLGIQFGCQSQVYPCGCTFVCTPKLKPMGGNMHYHKYISFAFSHTLKGDM